MAENAGNKIKLLKLYEYLLQESDESRPLSTSSILDYLEENGIGCDRRTLYRDIDCLNECGFDVRKKSVGHQNGYYVKNRSFDISEIKFLMDAVMASKSITEEKSREIIGKLSSLAGSHEGRLLSEHIVQFHTSRSINGNVMDSINTIEEAVRKKKKISFLYFDYDENKQKKYRKSGKTYVMDPVYLVYSDDNYYALCWNCDHGCTNNYRIDKMDSVTCLDEPSSTEARRLMRRASSEEYTKKVFQMYHGKPMDVVLEFPENRVNSVYDMFGYGTRVTKADVESGLYRAKVSVSISPVFYGWIFQFKGEIRIVTPSEIRGEYESLVSSEYRRLKLFEEKLAEEAERKSRLL